ncbi:MAG: glycosyltransferase [Candidatus Micrarchaeota archaeon]
MMKIAVVTDSYHPQKNGVVVFLDDFLPQIAKHADVVVLAPGESKLKVEKHGRIKTYWVPALPFPFYEGYRMSTARSRLITQIFKDEKPDVVHLHAPILLGLRALFVAKKMHLPVAATYHTHFPEYVSHLSKGLVKGKLEKFAQTPVKYLVGTVFSRADVTTAPTATLTRELKSYGVKNAVWVPNGIRFSKFRKRSLDSRKKYGIPENAPLVLYVGRISFEKKIEVLMSAFKKAQQSFPDAYLLIAGGGPYLKDYRKLAQAMNLQQVVFPGFVPDTQLPSLYAAANIFVSASDTETFGLTFVEAMHFGIPVIGANRLGAKDVITKQAGYLVEPGAVDPLASKLCLLLSNKKLRKKMGAAGKKEAKKYQMANVATQFLQLYRRMLR